MLRLVSLAAFDKFNFIPAEQRGIQENGVVGIENQLRMMQVDLVVVGRH